MSHDPSPKAWTESTQLRLKAARFLLEENCRADGLTRSYFAVFHAMRALLVSHGYEARTHKGAHMLLGKHFRNVMDTHFAHQLWDDREACDYELHVPPEEVVQQRLGKASRFLERAAELIASTP